MSTIKENRTDEKVSVWSESAARWIGRRKFVSTTVKGVFGIVGGVAIGNFTAIKKAFATTCTCNFARGNECSGSLVEYHCPSGCSTCTSSDYCGGYCDYSNGQWVSCSGLGQCGYGYRVCIDCKCPGCSNLCTLLSGIICSGCCSPRQVEEEMRQLHLLVAPTH